ncbi:hypothetical protein GSI_11479 [Ganoderma sinense ZZ0214-1]|uniref:Uncharacterized protein n=1 Tax=Ganoderma sinense ZZ0214-1 TaxID=1077348 RepID=A0A2G8RW42_9APHY|nr:hypothetical protein GSI_11479 [Ganoderma sinense ZZ0214-1]
MDPVLRPRSYQNSAAQIKALFPPASITLQNLVIRKTEKHLYEFLERVLVPGRLRGFATGPQWREDLPYVHQFLRSPAARNLLSISIDGIEDAYDQSLGATEASLVHETLGATLAQCMCAQYVHFGLIIDRETRNLWPDEGPLSESAPSTWCPLLANLPASLRALSLHVWILIYPGPPLTRGWARATRGWNSAARSLAAADRSLDPAGEGRRFRHLRSVELHVHFCYIETSGGRGDDAVEKRARRDIDSERAAMPLPRLKAAGLLREFRVNNMVHDPDHSGEFMADLYWPET